MGRGGHTLGDPLPTSDDELAATTEVPSEPGQASEPSLPFVFALWLPVFAVILWFMVRLFSGHWIHEPPPPAVPSRPDGDEDWGDAEDLEAAFESTRSDPGA